MNTEEASSARNYNTQVKQKLINWRNAFEKANCNSNLNYSAIAQRMEEEFGIRTSPQKISAMFDIQSSREVKLQELAALCQIFGIPIQDICEYPGVATSEMDVAGLISRKNSKQNAVHHLSNRFYEGRYYCYYFHERHYQDRWKPVEESAISEAILDIKIENGSTVVTMSENKLYKNFFGDQTAHAFTYTGKLYHLDHPDMAYCYLMDATGSRAKALMFSYIELSGDVRYYITAGMMSFSMNTNHAPLLQKMALFRVPQDIRNDPAQAEVVRGILALNTCPLILDEETMEQLTREDEDFKRLLSEEKALKKCYAFSETGLRSAAFFIRDDHAKMRKLLKLRKHSLYAAHEIVSEPDYFTDFIKLYQQDQLRPQETGRYE